VDPDRPARDGPVAFATSSALPNGSPDDLLALSFLRERGIVARPAVWDAPDVDWSTFAMVVVRSTWDYPRRYDEFMAWVHRAASVTRVWNPERQVAWNAHKSYLVDLARRGVDIVPTEVVRRGSSESLSEVLARRGWKDGVVKPAIGADAYRLRRVGPEDLATGERHLAELVSAGDALVQPFLSATPRLGERSLVYFDGRFSHAAAYPFVLSGEPREPQRFEPSPREIEVAGGILRGLPTLPLYARLDYLPVDPDRWLLGELELIEPELFLRGDPASPARFAEAIAQHL